MDKPTRNLIQKATQDARRLLESEFSEQLEGIFDILPNGRIEPEPGEHLNPRERIVREKIVAAIEHEKAGGMSNAEAVASYLREASYTCLNRFAALKMMEGQGLVQECVSNGEQSSGFREFCGLAPGLAELPDKGYRLYIESLFDELSAEIRVLFDRQDMASLLWPRRKAFEGLLDILNREELAGIWGEDETIGWVYQYFNSSEERKKMREESAAPRNSRELAVRNQFFTPRYVVEFLADNTLGRIWYEMRQGNTVLKEECRYLVRRPNEIFLPPNERAPETDDKDAGLSQEELLKQPVFVPFRGKKDPRDIKLIDPACGSGHLLLYPFDLLEKIYEEAWADNESPRSEATGNSLRQDYPTLEELKLHIPKLIIEHNLHGIDIDHRAVQITTLCLWMRAQRSWKKQGIKAENHPRITRSNIVTAEPMPGEKEMRKEFIASLQPRLLGQLVEEVFKKMELAGEAGALLKIEEEIKDSVAEAKRQWLKVPEPLQQSMFPDMVVAKPKQLGFRFDVDSVQDAEFWLQTEDRILAALKEYSEKAENGRAVSRRLFAEDAARGFAFIDLCRKRYDVVLMNPPFGQPTSEVFKALRSKYQGAHNDIFCSFVRLAISALGFGRVGVITSRSFLLSPRLEAFRTNDIIPHIEHLIDFGLGVMDDAYVESAGYILNSRGSVQFQSLDLRSSGPNHQIDLKHQLRNQSQKILYNSWYHKMPKSKILYSAPEDVRKLLDSKITFEPTAGTAREGMKSFNNERFIRLWWEPNPYLIGKSNLWVHLAKGGGFSFFYSDIHLILNWSRNGAELQAVNQSINGSTAQVRQASDYWYLPGATYSKRSAKGFSARALPADCIFTSNGPAVLPNSDWTPAFIVGWLNSKPVRAIIHMQANFADYSTGALKKIPWQIRIQDQEREHLERATVETIEGLREIRSGLETSICFRTAKGYKGSDEFSKANPEELMRGLMGQWDDAIAQSYGFDDLGWAEESLHDEAESGINDQEYDQDEEVDDDGFSLGFTDIMAYGIGCTCGRWDIRIGLEPSLSPKLPDPFDPLPVCPPGMLVGPDGLPAQPNRIVSEEWLRARPDANTLPPAGTVQNLTIPDSEYPIRISWDGILVDDPGFDGGQLHKEDIVRRTREVLNVLWKDKAQDIEQEACDILGVSDLRTYFRKSFFPDHIKRYSKSRRKAPIYWQLSTPSGSYSACLYYHRFTKDTFYKLLNEYVNPKLQFEERELLSAREQYGQSPTASQRKEIAARETFVSELKTFKEEVARIAPLLDPDLNDGVIINFAPLWRLVPQNRSWQKECKTIWDKLVNGDYDWAHLAMHLWPERVAPKCTIDRSLAIAHELDEVLWEEDEKGKWHARKISKENLNALIQERTSATVKAALEELLNASVANGSSRRKTKRKS